MVYTKDGQYILGASDEVKISVLGDATFGGTYVISEDGRVLLPLVGNVEVGGLTPHQARNAIAKNVAPLVKNPNVVVAVAAKKSCRVLMSGEVARVGVLQFDIPTNLLSAIALAGGFTPYASGRIVVIRKLGDGKLERFAVSRNDLENGKYGMDKFFIERDDMIIVE